MSFQPVVPVGGYAGWRFLARTAETQRAAFDRASEQRRRADHFRAAIATADTAEKLVGDRRLLQVALEAYGLGADLDSRAFIRTVLEGGTLKPEALANKLSDKRYAALALEFGYGNLGARTGLPGFADRILARYQAQAFQEAVGEQDGDLRLALNVGGALTDVVAANATPKGRWFALMGNAPLRQVVQTALGFPQDFAKVDIDQQLAQFRDRARSVLGTDDLARLSADGAAQETMIRLFLVRSQAQEAGMSPGQVSLTLLASLG